MRFHPLLARGTSRPGSQQPTEAGLPWLRLGLGLLQLAFGLHLAQLRPEPRVYSSEVWQREGISLVSHLEPTRG